MLASVKWLSIKRRRKPATHKRGLSTEFEVFSLVLNWASSTSGSSSSTSGNGEVYRLQYGLS
jgi:hypothetical protein